jgi:tetratricopeptide (TPR) repeat protein
VPEEKSSTNNVIFFHLLKHRLLLPVAALFLLTATAPPLPADLISSIFQTGPQRPAAPDDEKKALRDADQSYKDGAFDLCNDRVTEFLKKYPKSALAPEAELLQARALYQLGRDSDALAALSLPPEQVPAYILADTLFWQAEILLDAGKWPDAEQKYRVLLALKDTGGHTEEANLGLAWALFKEGREADAQTLILALTGNGGKAQSPAGQQARLLSAKIALSKGQFKEAIAGLTALLAMKPAPGTAFEANYWLGETYSANNQADKAVTAYENITGDLQSPQKPPAFPKTLVAQAYLGLGRALHALRQSDQAELAYEQAYQLTESAEVQMDAFLACLENARAAGKLPEAVEKLQDFAKNSDPAGTAAPAALFAMGSVLAEDNENDKAIGILESLRVAYAKSAWIPPADYQLGLLYAQTNKPDQAATSLQACIEANSDPTLVRKARFELGNILLQTKDYAGAAAQFAQVSDGADAPAENASYNFLLTQAWLAKPDIFLKAEADYKKRFPQSDRLNALAKIEATLLADAGRIDEAKTACQHALAQPGGGPGREALLKLLADLQYQTNDLAGTVATCRQIVDQFPGDSLDAAVRGILVSYEMKKLTDDQVEQKLEALVQKYDKTPAAAATWFQLGEFYYYRQDYVKAQDAFQQLTANYPASEDADQAYFFAGCAAAKHYDFAAARTLLEKVPDASALKPDARLWEARVCQQQHDFPQAAALADAVLASEKTGPHFVEASLLKGQCLFALGGTDPSDYALALAAFDPVVKNKDATIAQRNEAAVREAKCLEKMGRTDDAMALYLDVLYGRVAGDDASSPAPPEFSWQIKACWEAGRIREAQKDWRGAIEIYKRGEQIGGADQQKFRDLENQLRQENYIY